MRWSPLGLLLLLFVAYQLWGTGIYQARAQNDLEEQFDSDSLAAADDAATTTTSAHRHRARPASTTTSPRATRAPPRATRSPGSGSRRSGSTSTWSRASTSTTCARGPGTTRARRLPGHEGNSAIAGHRTTYGAPFGDLDQLDPGDEINVTTVQGRFLYR